MSSFQKKIHHHLGRIWDFLEGNQGGFSKISLKFGKSFFSSTELIFWALPSHCEDPIFTKFSAPQANFLKKKQAKKAFLGIFWKKLTKKSRFFRVRSHSKISDIFAKAPLEKFKDQSTKNGHISKQYKGGRISEGGGGVPPPPSKSAGAYHVFWGGCLHFLGKFECKLPSNLSIVRFTRFKLLRKHFELTWDLIIDKTFALNKLFNFFYFSLHMCRW